MTIDALSYRRPIKVKAEVLESATDRQRILEARGRGGQNISHVEKKNNQRSGGYSHAYLVGGFGLSPAQLVHRRQVAADLRQERRCSRHLTPQASVQGIPFLGVIRSTASLLVVVAYPNGLRQRSQPTGKMRSKYAQGGGR